MSHLKPYPNYKPSGVEWLGDVPEGWEVASLRRLADVKTGGTPTEVSDDYFESGGFNWFTPGDFSEAQYLGNSDRQLSALGKANVRIFPEMTVMLVSIGATIGKVAISDRESSCNQQINAIVCNHKWHYSFAAYYLRIVKDFIVKCGKFTTMPIINQDETKNLLVALPRIEEQSAIAAFLDRETGRIDALVEKKQRFMALLKEKRQALITDAVTGKFDVRTGKPYPNYKPSGVEWLGDVPEGWEVKRIGSIYREASDQGIPDLPVLTISIHTGASDGELDPSERDRKVVRSEDKTKYKTVCKGDLVYNMMRAWQGGFGAVVVDGLVSPAYVVARPISEVSSRFVELVLRTPQATEAMRRYSHGITDFRLRLYWEKFKTISLTIPSLVEQDEIMSKIDCETGRIDALVEKTGKSIELLKERRSALITAAVTGKIDVRHHVSHPSGGLQSSNSGIHAEL